MDDIANALLGAIIGFTGAMLGERLKRVHASRVAAMMILRELAFHQQRLHQAIYLDQIEDAQYQLMFPTAVWSAQAAAFVAGAPTKKVEPVLNWYASLAVLGSCVGRQISENGPMLIGPARDRLDAALSEAYAATALVSAGRSVGGRKFRGLPLFEDVTQ